MANRLFCTLPISHALNQVYKFSIHLYFVVFPPLRKGLLTTKYTKLAEIVIMLVLPRGENNEFKWCKRLYSIGFFN